MRKVRNCAERQKVGMAYCICRHEELQILVYNAIVRQMMQAWAADLWNGAKDGGKIASGLGVDTALTNI